jgi:hypothetical protein
LKKNIQPDEIMGMIRKQKQREAGEGKETAFNLRGRPVDQSKIERYKRDHGIDEDGVMGEDKETKWSTGGRLKVQRHEMG